MTSERERKEMLALFSETLSSYIHVFMQQISFEFLLSARHCIKWVMFLPNQLTLKIPHP